MLSTSALTWVLHLFSSWGNMAPVSEDGWQHDRHRQGVELIDAQLKDRIHKLRHDWDVPGLGVVIVATPKYRHPTSPEPDPPDGSWRTSYLSSGIRSIRGDEVTPWTMWGIASNSKFFTTVAIGMLMHDGVTLDSGEKLSWDTTVREALDWVVMEKYVEEHLTLGDLLSMQSGLPRHDLAAQQGTPPEQLLKHMAHFRPSSGIRQTWQYNNYVYHIAPLLFTRYANMSFVDFVQKRIFDPLSMFSATYNFVPAPATGSGRYWYSESFFRKGKDLGKCDADQVWKDGLPKSCVGEFGSGGYWNGGRDSLGIAGAGGINMTLRDMAKWLRELLDPKVIPPSVLKDVLAGRMVTEAYPRQPEMGLNTYCLGQETYSYRGHQIYQHTGGLPAMASYFMRVPDKGIGVFAIANDNGLGSYIGEAVSYVVLDHLLGLDPIDWAARLLPDALKELRDRQAEEEIPVNPRPRANITGTYHHPSYPTLHVRTVTPEEEGVFGCSQSAYVAEIDFYFVTRLIFTHLDGPVWQWRRLKLYPEHMPDGSTGDTPLLYDTGHGTCVFAEKGLGFFGNFWGQGGALTKSKPDEEHTEEKAEVWFSKE